MDLGDGLGNKGFCWFGGGGGRRGLGHLFKDVEGFLVFFAADAHADPGFGDVDKEGVLGPGAGGLDFFEGEVGAILGEVEVCDKGDAGER